MGNFHIKIAKIQAITQIFCKVRIQLSRLNAYNSFGMMFLNKKSCNFGEI